jgi:hypothetical protein
MPINFPNGPATNDTYSYDAKSWIWSGSYWKALGTTNYVSSFNGCTGDIGITGTANQVIVTGISCSEIVIGLPTSITITGTMNADRFIGRMDGGAF